MEPAFIKESVKIVLATALMALVLSPLQGFAEGLFLFPVVGIGALVFGLAGVMLRIEAVSTLVQKVLRKILPPPPPPRS